MEITLLENERMDDLGRRGYRIIQNKTKFCFGVDATLLAWFAQVKKEDLVMDFCSGTGIVPILMDARYACGQYTGLEIQKDMVEMANRSAKLNQIENHVQFVQGDLKEASTLFKKSFYDVVTVNPPYMPKSTGLKNPDSDKAIARHEVLCTLSDVVEQASKLLKFGGHFYMVHRPVRLPNILEEMKQQKISPERVCFVHPYPDKEATMVLVSGVRGGHTLLKVEPPVVIYQEKEVYSETIRRIYQD